MSAPGGRALLVVFGVALGGEAGRNPALQRRIDHAVRALAREPELTVLCSGGEKVGQGRRATTRAATIRASVAMKMPDAAFLFDTRSRSLVAAVFAAVRIAREGGFDHCVACIDPVLQRRTLLLFRLAGMPADGVRWRRRRKKRRVHERWLPALREAALLPVTLVAGLGARMIGREQAGDVVETGGDMVDADPA